MPLSRLVNRNILAKDRRTSMRLEPELWDALSEICNRQGITVGELVQDAERAMGSSGRTSAVRVYTLGYFRAAATEAGHATAGHGHVQGRSFDRPRITQGRIRPVAGNSRAFL